MNPITREEQYYDAILQNAQGGDAEVPEPITREEMYLKQIAENVGSGGSGVPAGGTTGQLLGKKSDADGDVEWKNAPEGTLPATTSADAGKFARVDEDGNWDKDGGDDLARTDGYYENMGVGTSDQLASSVGVHDSVPYNFRSAGGSADIGVRAENKFVGGSLAWNQLVQNGNFADAQYWGNGNITITVSDNTASGIAIAQNQFVANAFQQSGVPIVGHKMLYTMQIKADSNKVSLFAQGTGTRVSHSGSGTFERLSIIVNTDTTATKYIGVIDMRSSDWTEFQMKNAMVFDLTQMFGSAIADHIAALETATAGAGVAWFRKLFSKDYYAYNAGTLMSVKVGAYKTTEFNQYHNGTARVIGGMEYQITGTYSSLSLNGATITPDSNGKFTPDADGELTVTGGGTDTCVHFVYDGERDGEYEPYREHIYPLDTSIELRGIPKLDASDKLYYDGDTYESDGTVTRRYGIVDLGTLEWEYSQSTGKILTRLPDAYNSGLYNSGTLANIICSKYVTVINNDAYSGTTDKGIGLPYYNGFAHINLKDSSKTASDIDENGHASWLEGVYLVYELATPTTEQAEPFTAPQIVNNWGTETLTDYAYEAGDRDVEIPVGHDTFYQQDLRSKLEVAPDSPDGDGDYIVRQTNGANEYVPLSGNETIQALLGRIPAAPTEDGTYVLKATVSNGTVTYGWEAE